MMNSLHGVPKSFSAESTHCTRRAYGDYSHRRGLAMILLHLLYCSSSLPLVVPAIAPSWPQWLQERSHLDAPVDALALDVEMRGGRKVPWRRALHSLPPHIKWEPRPDRFLLMTCGLGQISNLVSCMRNHVVAAALLHRMLIVPRDIYVGPDRSRDYNLHLVWDLNHTRLCHGADTVLELDDYVARFGAPLRVDLVNCWNGPRGYCPSDQYVDDCPARLVSAEDASRSLLKGSQAPPGPTLRATTWFFEPYPNIEVSGNTVATASCLPRRMGVQAFLSAFATDVRMLVIGEMVHVKLAGDQSPWRGEDPFQRLPSCPNSLSVFPPRAVVDEAVALAASLFGGDPFLALHWRRGDFSTFCQSEPTARGHCTYLAPQAASCLSAALRRHNLSAVFLATNAYSYEVGLLKKCLRIFHGAPVRVFRLADAMEQLKLARGRLHWLTDSGRHHSLLDIELDKLICSQGRVFVGSVFSSFSEDIRMLRFGRWGEPLLPQTRLCDGRGEWEWERTQGFLMQHHFLSPDGKTWLDGA